MTISIEKSRNGVEPVVVVRFGVKCRTFTAAKWDELSSAVQEAFNNVSR